MPAQYKIILITLLSYMTCYGQQVPQLSSFKENLFTWNSAYTARQDSSLHMILNHRKDWSQFDDSPQNSSYAMILPFKSHSGTLGIFVGQESVGILNNSVANLSYAYLVKLSESTSIIFGNSFIFQNRRFKLSTLNTPSGEFNIRDAQLSTLSIALNHGVQLRIGDNTPNQISLGASMHNSLNDEIIDALEDIDADNYLKFNALYSHGLSKSGNLSVGVYYLLQLSGLKSELNTYIADLSYQYKTYHLGTRYNSNGFVSLYGNVRMNNFLLGLNWEYWTNSLNLNAGSGYEVLLGYIFNLKK